MRILVTRPEGEATRDALERLGHTVLLDPLLRIVPRAVEWPEGRFDALVATSANAFREDPGSRDASGTPLPNLAVVGQRTATAARSAGWPDPGIVAPDADAVLAAIVASWPAPRRILHLAGLHQATDLAARLRDLGHQVETLVTYEAVAAASLAPATLQALQDGTIDAVLHYSARTAAAFVSACRGAVALGSPAIRHICLSERVAEPLRAAGMPGIRVAARPDEPALLAALSAEPGDGLG